MRKNKLLIVTKTLFLSLLILIGFFVIVFNSSQTVFAKQDFPKTVNYFLTPTQSFDYDALAKYDLLILPIDTQIYNQSFFGYARLKNPDMIILAYTPSQSVNVNSTNDKSSFNYKLNRQVESGWWLKDDSGQIISTWPGLKNININSNWADWFPSFVKEQVLDSNLWDGIFYDMVDAGISHANNGNVDINNDGRSDISSFLDNQWQTGYQKLLKNSRKIFGNDKIILINGSSIIEYQTEINGRMFEDFPTPWEGDGLWQDSLNLLKQNQTQVKNEKIFILNGLGQVNNYQEFRFGLASALIVGEYFGYDNSIDSHHALWWYDEYDANLGQPLSAPKNLFNPNSTNFEVGVWQREFENGIALVNSTNKTQTVELDSNGVYEKIRGNQDAVINNGQLVKEITLAANDGIILLRKLNFEQINDTVFTNGQFVRVFDKRGQTTRAGFYAYDEQALGGDQIINTDIDGDGQQEKIVASKTLIKIFDNLGNLVTSFAPYGADYKQGINLAVGNVTGGSSKEIIVGTMRGASPLVKIFSSTGQVIHEGFLTYDKNFKGGVQVALGDLNGNGYQEIVTGAGAGGGPHVMIFDSSGHLFDPGFFPYDPAFRGGVNVTCADLNLDGKDEIITGAGAGGGPHVRIYDKTHHLVDPGFFAFDSSKRNGVKVSATDIDGDGQVEILTAE